MTRSEERAERQEQRRSVACKAGEHLHEQAHHLGSHRVGVARAADVLRAIVGFRFFNLLEGIVIGNAAGLLPPFVHVAEPHAGYKRFHAGHGANLLFHVVVEFLRILVEGRKGRMSAFGTCRDVLLAVEREEADAHAGTRANNRLGGLLRGWLAAVGMRELENLFGVIHVERRDAVADGHEVVDDKRRDAGRRSEGVAIYAPREIRHHALVVCHRARSTDTHVAGLEVGTAFCGELERFTNRGIEAVDILGGADGFENQSELAVFVAYEAKVRVGAANVACKNEAVKLCIGIKPFDFHKKLRYLYGMNIGKTATLNRRYQHFRYILCGM